LVSPVLFADGLMYALATSYWHASVREMGYEEMAFWYVISFEAMTLYFGSHFFTGCCMQSL